MRRLLVLASVLAFASSLTVPLAAGAGPRGAPADRASDPGGTGVLPNFATEATEGQALVRLQVGAFDPLTDAPPAPEGVPTVDGDALAGDELVYWLVQVQGGRYASARQAIDVAGGHVVSVVPDDTYVVRATPAQRGAWDLDPAVRWSGLLQPAWKVPVAAAGRPGLLELQGTQHYRVYGFRDDPRRDALADALRGIDGVRVLAVSGPVVDVAATAAEVPAMAGLAQVQWIGLVPEARPLNAQARWVNDTAIRDVHAATLPGRLDGSGQTAAVADTALNYFPDLNGRAHLAFRDCPDYPTDCLLADYTMASPGNSNAALQDVVFNDTDHRKLAAYFDLGGAGTSPRDVSAHGTHVAGSVTGDIPGTGGAYGTYDGDDGLAPAARLVHQNISTSSGGLGGLPGDDYQLWRQAYRPRDPASVPESYDPAEYADYEPLLDARTHNNSYGLIVPVVDEGSAAALDEFVWHHEDMVVVVSAGNGGPAPGSIGTPSVAKNSLSSAASANGRQPMVSIDSLASFSSHGPTGDGRLGPDLATPGQTVISPKGGSEHDDHYLQGTSMSGPVLTGLATLVRQYFFDGYGPALPDPAAGVSLLGFPVGDDAAARSHNPSAALIKAALINGAERMRGWYTGDDGSQRPMDGQWPSAGQGFGLVSLDGSLYFDDEHGDDTRSNWFVDVWRDDDLAFDVSDNLLARQFTIDVAEGEPLDVTLSWADAPSATFVGTPALVNNLDLFVSGPSGAFYGNNLNTRANPGAAEATSVFGTPDTRNLAERVRIADPEPGTYTIWVEANGVLDGPQGFALAASGLLSPEGSLGLTPAEPFEPGAPLLVDEPGAPAIDEASVVVDTYSADTATIRFTTDEPTTAGAVVAGVDLDGDEADDTFLDVYNRAPGDTFTDHYQTGPVETSSAYAGRPVVGTDHEILVYGLQPGTTYEVELVAEDLFEDPADPEAPPNQDTAATQIVAPAHAYQPFAADIGQLTEGPTDNLPSFVLPGSGWRTGTQLYAGEFQGSGLLGAFMFRLPEEGIDLNLVTGAAIELTGMHVFSSLYDADAHLLVDLLPESFEPRWGTQNYREIHNAPREARALPESEVLIGGQVRHAYTFACADLEALKASLATVTDGERRAAFRYDAVVDQQSITSVEFGFNRRSRGPELRPRLVLFTGDDPNATRPCDPSTPAPTISDVAIAPALEPGAVTVSWRTDVPADSRVIFRERGTTQWVQVATPMLERSHQVQVRGLDPSKDYEFGVRSTACNGASATVDNGGAGWDFFRAPPPEVETEPWWFHGSPDDEARKLGSLFGFPGPDATFDQEEPGGGPPVVQNARPFVNMSFYENPLAAYWTGPFTGPLPGNRLEGELEVEWWWSSSNGKSRASIEVVVFADVDRDASSPVQPDRIIGSTTATIPVGPTPTRAETRVPVNGVVESEMIIQVGDAGGLNPSALSVYYDSSSTPSGFGSPIEPPPPVEDLPLAGPVPPPSAEATGLDLGAVPTRDTPTTADMAAGTGANCPIPALSVGDAQVQEGDEGTTDAVVEVTLLQAELATGPVTVQYRTEGESAAPGDDFAPQVGTLTFEQGDSRELIRVPVHGNSLDQFDRTFSVLLHDAQGAVLARPRGTVTILDDDDPPSVSIGDVTQEEGNEGTTPFDFPVTLSEPSGRTVQVDYGSADGSAQAGRDYQAAGGTLTFNPGDTERSVAVQVTGDTEPEPDRQFRVDLTDPTNVVLAKGRATGTILDDDTAGTRRLEGTTRYETSADISRSSFPDDGSASVAVLARGDEPDGYADALAGTPLAVELGGPMLITEPDRLHPATEEELTRVLPEGTTVILLGGDQALHPTVEDRVRELGYPTRRIFGPTRIETAIEIARELGDPDTLLIARGYAFPDALAAGPAAVTAEGAVLLGLDDSRHPATESYLQGRPGAQRYAIGGQMAGLYPEAEPVFGSGRIETGVAVAREFFEGPTVVGIARADKFPDSLTGGAHIGRRDGPMLLTQPPETAYPSGLDPATESFLCDEQGSVRQAFIYGGTLALSEQTEAAVDARIRGEGCG